MRRAHPLFPYFHISILLFAAAAPAGALDLARDSRALATIAAAPGAAGVERAALDDLRLTLNRITGAEFTETTEAPRGPAIIVGCPETHPLLKGREEYLGLTPERVGDEGYVLRVEGDRLFIAGRTAFGAANGIYAFLEKHLGVRWFYPGETGEVIPKVTNLAVGALDEADKPDFAMRFVQRYGDWARRNRTNGRDPSDEVATALRTWPGYPYHTFGRLANPKEHFDAHPDWFPLIGGERRKTTTSKYAGIQGDMVYTYGHQICTSNPSLIQAVLDRMDALLAADPGLKVICLSPNDGQGWCECDACRALDEPTDRSDQKLSRRLVAFYREVGERLARKHPGVQILAGAYNVYNRPPNDPKATLPPNVSIILTHYNDYCMAHPVTHSGRVPEAPGERCRNTDFREVLEGWSKRANGVHLYEYYWKVNWIGLPWPIVHCIRQDIPYFRTIGVKGLYTQATENWGPNGLAYYAAAKLLWDADTDVDALLTDCYRKLYGPGADTMRRYFETLEAAMAGSPRCLAGGWENAPRVFPPAVIEKCAALLAEARQAAGRDATVGARIALQERTLEYARRMLPILTPADAGKGRVQDAIRRGGLLAALRKDVEAGRYRNVVAWNGEVRTYYDTIARQVAGCVQGMDLPAVLPKAGEPVGPWRMATAPVGEGERRGWHQPGFDDAGWSEEAHVGTDGETWYRARWEWARPAEGRSAFLMGLAGGPVRAYVDGTLVGDVPAGAVEVDVTPRLTEGRTSTLALCVRGGRLEGEAGIYAVPPDIWRSGASADRCGLPPKAQADLEWTFAGPYATLDTKGRNEEYAGAWLELDFSTRRPGPHRVWLRVTQYQASETKTLFLDGKAIGSLQSREREERGLTEFIPLADPVEIPAGWHTLRIECSGIVGYVDHVNWVLVTPDLKADPEAAQKERTPASIPVRPAVSAAVAR